jgi:hypothetical protein
MKKIAFDIALICAYHEERMASSWFNAIKENGKRCLIITPNYNEFIALKEQTIDVLYLNDFAPQETPSINKMESYFNERGVASIKDFISTEKAYYGLPSRFIKQAAYRYAVAFEKLFDQFNIKCILHPVQGGEVVRSAASLIAPLKSVKVFYLGETFIPNTMNLYLDEMRTLIRVNRPEKLTNQQAEEFIKEKLKRKPVIFYETTLQDYVVTPLYKKALRLIKAGNWNIIHAYFSYKKIIHIDRRLKDIYSKLSNTFSAFDPSKKYFYYPFNVDAESELFIRNKEFVDQASTIEKLATYLPEEYMLYVKTHPGVEGHLSIRSYTRLKKLKNVVILHSKINSFNVVQNSKGVIIVSSTVGLESFIVNKPTCIIGNWPYHIYSNFIVTKDLSEVFDKLLNHSEPNEAIEFVKGLYNDTIDGTIYGSKENFKTLVASFLKIAEKAYSSEQFK